MLIDRTADVDAADPDGNTPLHLACMHARPEVAAALLSAGCERNLVNDVGQAPVHLALRHRQVLDVVLQYRPRVDQRDEEGNTAMHLACRDGLAEAVSMLLEIGGARAGAGNHALQTPLHLAAWAGRIACMELLLEAQADVERKDESDRTALHLAASGGRAEAVALLVRAGAEKEAGDIEGRTPLHLACWNGHGRAAATLIEAGADVSAADKLGVTPLHLACEAGDAETAQALLAADARADAADSEGTTPRQLADESADEELIAALDAAWGRQR
jgi:ankyrin repeat protein